MILTGRMKELAEQEQTDIGNAKESFDILNRIIEENAAIAQTVMDKTKNLEALKLDIINSVSELSAISEENADRKSTRLNSSHRSQSRMPSSA